MALIPYPDPDELPDDVRTILEATPQNIVRMMVGMGGLFKPLMTLAGTFFNHGALAPSLRELLTLRMGHRMGAVYMLRQHDAMARSAGVTEAQMEAIAGPLPSSHFSDAENAAIILIDALIDQVKVSEDLVLDAYALIGETGLHELFVISGFYHLTARYTESLRIDVDGGTKGNALDQMKRLGRLEG